MAKRPTHPLLQVLFEPWPASAGADREGYEVFAGHYLLDALDENGDFIDRGYRAVVAGCTTCRRSPLDDKVHYPNLNDLAPDKPKRRCPQWKTVEAVVKSFGGWKRVQYVELAENEGLHYQPVPQRRFDIVKCSACDGTGYDKATADMRPSERLRFPLCKTEGCGSYQRGHHVIPVQGPVRPDRHSMTAVQRRMRV